MADSQSTKPPSDLWLSVRDQVVQACLRGGEIHSEIIGVGIRSMCEDGRFESPIEAIFAAWWQAVAPVMGSSDLGLLTQEEVVVGDKTYRLDFTVAMDSHPGTYGSGVLNPYPKIAIELDGHDYHEKTKEQVTYRNQRDRDLQGAGWKVLHVSGSELYCDPENCVKSVAQIVRREYSGFWSAYWAELNAKAGL